MSSSSSDEEEYSTEGCESRREGRNSYPTYTQEQKIVSAVWMHERSFNYQTMEDIRNNFRIRFKTEPPLQTTLSSWEKRLFSSGILVKEKNRRPLERLIHVPYVKASLKEKPRLSLTERACQLGLTKNILRQILKYDIKDSDKNQKKVVQENTDGDSEVQIIDDHS